MNNMIYVGFVLAGAFTLIIEAYRNFNSTSARHPFDLHPILKAIEVRHLCTNGELIFGFTCYVAFYIIAYFVILSSAELYGLLLKFQNASIEIGASDTQIDIGGANLEDEFSFIGSDYNKPLIVSALIITSLSIGAVKPIEHTMRSLAQRLSGVPRGVYRVISGLRGLKYDEIMQGQAKPLDSLYDQMTNDRQGSRTDPLVAKSLKKIQDSSDIRSTLVTVDCLRRATNAVGYNLYFPLQEFERMQPVSAQIESDYDSLLKKLSAPPSQEQVQQYTQELQTQAALLKANLMAFFAVLFIRNNRTIYNAHGDETRRDGDDKQKANRDPVLLMRDKLAEPEKDEHNAFALSLIIAFVPAFIITIALYYFWLFWSASADPAQYAKYLSDPVNSLVDANKCPSAHALVCEGAVKAYLQEHKGDIFKAASWDQFQSIIVTGVSVLLVMLGRDVRLEEQSWRDDWKMHQFPFLRFLGLCIFSGLAAFFLTALTQFAKLAVAAGILTKGIWPTKAQTINLFDEYGDYFATQIGAGIILAMFALVIMDKHKHERWHMRRTLFTAALGGLLYLSFQWGCLLITVPVQGDVPGALFSKSFRDALIYSLLPALFLLSFGWLLELSEKHGDTEHKTRAPGMPEPPLEQAEGAT